MLLAFMALSRIKLSNRYITMLPGNSENPFLHCFTLVFDREGYSPDFLLEMKKDTYHKYQGEDWPCDEFKMLKISFSNVNIVEMELADQKVFLQQGCIILPTKVPMRQSFICAMN